MKKIVIILIFIGQGLTVLAQCVNGTSTNPSNPINNQIGATHPELLNSFLWVDPAAVANHGLNLYSLYNMNTPNNTPVTQMFNPYHLANQSYSYLTQGDLNKLDYHWEDGWEMLNFNLGQNPDGSVIFPVNQSIPYILFYNRYRGIIRVFFNSLTGVGGSSYDGITINLQFADDTQLSGIFMPAQTILQGLDKYTNMEGVFSYSDHPNNSSLWCHADFQVGYDPCVCIFRSDIRVKFKFKTVTDLEMVQRGITIEQNLINADGTINDVKDFLTNVSAEKSGLAVYKSIDLMVSNYQTQLENVKRQNAAAKEHNQKIGFWKTALSLAKLGLPKVDTKIEGLGIWGHDKISKIVGNDTLVSPKNISDAVKKGLASGLDWLGGEFLSEKPYATNPTMPTAMFTESKYKGTLTTSINSVAGTFYNPGSYTGGQGHWSYNNILDAHTYPYYNEMMGVFALLETPQVDLKSHTEHSLTKLSRLSVNNTSVISERNYLIGKINDTESFNYFVNRANLHAKHLVKKALKLNKPLKYQFNPALDIKEYDIQAMWVMKIKRPEISTSKKIKSSISSSVSQVNMTSLDVNQQGMLPDLIGTTGDSSSYTFNSAMVPLDKLYNFQPEIHLNDNFSRVFNTGIHTTFMYYPSFGTPPRYLGVAQNFESYTYANFLTNFTANHFSNIITPQDLALYANEFNYEVTVQLKLIIDVTYNNVGSDGAPTRQLFVQTYAIEDEDITNINNSPSYNGQTTPAYNLNTIPENLLFNTPNNFNGNSVAGCSLNNGLYTCLAQKEINITGNINITAPYKVEFVAGTKIDVHQNTNVYGNKRVRLKIGSIMQSTPMPEASQSEVTNFCNGSGTQPYKANQSRARSGDFNTSDEEVLPIEKELKIGLGIYPNPVTNQTQHINVNYITNSNALTKIYVTDLYGRVVIDVQTEKQVNSGLYKIPVDIGTLTPGIYLCTIIANNQRKTEKIVVLK